MNYKSSYLDVVRYQYIERTSFRRSTFIRNRPYFTKVVRIVRMVCDEL